jgi:hypothetical protein
MESDDRDQWDRSDREDAEGPTIANQPGRSLMIATKIS